MGKKTIMIIDDEVDLLDVLGTALKASGYKVICSENGKDGLRELYSQKPDLLILDLMLPMLSGAEILSKIKNDLKMADLPVVILTAQFVDSDMEKKLTSYPKVELLRKPYDIKTLIDGLKKYF